MASQHDKAKRWRPRFSVRTLAIVVTLVCCYAACWGPTKRWGVREACEFEYREHAGWYCRPVAPFLVRLTEIPHNNLEPPKNCYYFWFFGYVAKLPYEREVPLQQ
jgi:hypothetical protein